MTALGSSGTRRRIILAAALLLAACGRQGGGTATETVKNRTPAGTVEMHQVQAAFIGSGNTGDGTLRFQGRSYPFMVSGLGIGGIGVSTLEATGDVYDLKKADDFEGAYVQGRYGFAIGEESGGVLWLKNDKGVVMRLKAKRTGLMLSLGGDAVVITLK
ncbi:hypothetical protein BWR60_32595 [Inquilinus limosus]|uniref:DUF1134 domain-containing protein n=2 Tax=Inquilinus limosus TaxID=171674 RepID=A0A211Z1T1_9PROT|nr:hypothetical protein BWR60_32595 [Inquilinus limosus]